MSDFGNKNVRLFALFVPIFALISRVDFSQPKCIGRLKSTLPAFKIDAIVILKDHIHFILQPENINDYPNIIKYFKTYFSRNINIDNSDLTDGKKYKKEKGVWQSRYWAHIILDENDLNKHIDYIHYNPMKHYKITPKDWEYSSFKKYVYNKFYDMNWCNFDD